MENGTYFLDCPRIYTFHFLLNVEIMQTKLKIENNALSINVLFPILGLYNVKYYFNVFFINMFSCFKKKYVDR